MLDRVVQAWRHNDLGSAYSYWRRHGMAATVRQVGNVLLEPTPPLRARPIYSPAQLIERQFLSLTPLPIRLDRHSRRRLNLVTDTINPPHLYGGVGTALIFAVLFAERTGRSLRIITRSARAQEQNFAHIMQVAGLTFPSQVEFAFAAYGSHENNLDCADDELFVTTSWWTTHGTRQVIHSNRIIYLIQEDERMFYPHGDEQLRCTELLKSTELTFLINTKILSEYFRDSGLANIPEHGVWFEPAFSQDIFYAQDAPAEGSPYRFLYYARPKNQRNLFYRGLEAIDKAVASGILRPDQWEIYFVGKDLPRIKFGETLEPQLYENLSWMSYAALTRKMDLGLCLMYTPHPSYPPLDLAASGAVVVTNRFGSKSHLNQYSKNILCKEPTVDDLVQGLAEGVALVQKSAQRRDNYQANRILRDWRQSFARPLEVLTEKFSSDVAASSKPVVPVGDFTYKGFTIPLDLVLATGAGPETFDRISRTHMRNIEEYIGINPTDQVLEIGCGIGRDAIPLTERLSAQGSYVGIDIMKRSIDWCRAQITPRHPNFRFEHYDVRDGLYNPSGQITTSDIVLPVEDGSLDLIILQSVFTHMFEADISHFLREFRRVLKPDGRVYATLFLYDDQVLESARATNLTPYDLRFENERNPGCRFNSLECETAAIAYTEASFTALVEAAGLQLVAPYLRGSWSGFFKEAADGQDRAVLGKAPSNRPI